MALFSSKLMSPVAVTSLLAMLLANPYPGFAQGPVEAPLPPAEQQGPPPPQLLAATQLDNLVAPVALYPDPLLSQLLVAATYPLEIVEAQQWLGQNGNLQGQQLVDAAKQQNWDPSVQALVAFPEAMTMLTRDIRWTTDLGNAFLAQQADVMSSVQRMRAAARNNGRLTDTPQQTIAMENQDGQSAIAIQPANPQVIYPPVYDPAYVWGPPAYGEYPDLGYAGASYGFGYGTGVFIGGLFSGLLSSSWGWGFSWLGHSLFLNGLFFDHCGYHGYGAFGRGGFGGRGGYSHVAWAHNPSHRLGVPYARGGFGGRGGYGRGGYGTNYGRNGGTARFNDSRGFGGQRGSGGQRNFNGQQAFNGQRGSNGRQGFSGQQNAGNLGTAGRGFAGNNRGRGSSPGQQAARGYAPGGYSNARGSNNSASYASPGRSYQSSTSRSFAAAPARSFSPAYRGSSARGFSSPGFSSGASRSFTRPSGPSQSFSRPASAHQSFSRQSFSRPSSSHQSHPSVSRSSGSHSSGHQSSGQHSGGGSRRR